MTFKISSSNFARESRDEENVSHTNASRMAGKNSSYAAAAQRASSLLLCVRKFNRSSNILEEIFTSSCLNACACVVIKSSAALDMSVRVPVSRNDTACSTMRTMRAKFALSAPSSATRADKDAVIAYNALAMSTISFFTSSSSSSAASKMRHDAVINHFAVGALESSMASSAVTSVKPSRRNPSCIPPMTRNIKPFTVLLFFV